MSNDALNVITRRHYLVKEILMSEANLRGKRDNKFDTWKLQEQDRARKVHPTRDLIGRDVDQSSLWEHGRRVRIWAEK